MVQNNAKRVSPAVALPRLAPVAFRLAPEEMPDILRLPRGLYGFGS